MDGPHITRPSKVKVSVCITTNCGHKNFEERELNINVGFYFFVLHNFVEDDNYFVRSEISIYHFHFLVLTYEL